MGYERNSEATTFHLAKLLFVVGILTAVAVAGFAYTNSGQAIVSANVVVHCPFTVALTSSSSVYIVPTNIMLTYTVNSLYNCVTQSASGPLTLSNSVTNTVIYTNTVTMTGITNTAASNTFTQTSNKLEVGSDTAFITLTSSTDSNSASVSFTVLSAANVLLQSFAASPNPATPGSVITFTSNEINDGALATTNSVANLEVVAPGGSLYLANSPIADLSPGQSQIISLSVSGVSSQTGTYTAYENVSYFTDGSNAVSSNAMTQYSVQTPSPSPSHGGGPSPNQTTPIVSTIQNTLLITTLPIYVSQLDGEQSIQYLGVKNTANYSIWANFSVPQQGFGKLLLSSKSIYLMPNSTGVLQYVISVSKNATPATYLSTLNATLSAANHRSINQSIYSKVNIVKPDDTPYLLSSIILLNGSNSAEMEFTIANPTNKTYYNLQLSAQLPAIAIACECGVSQTGGVHNITNYGASYLLNWKIQALQPKTSLLYISTINKTIQPQLLTTPRVSLTAPTVPQASGLFRILYINVLPVYVNSTGHIQIGAIYTGTNTTNVTFSMVPPPGYSVQNPLRAIKVSPNQVLMVNYTTGILSQQGTTYFTFDTTGYFGRQNYPVPVLVSPIPTTSIIVVGGPSPALATTLDAFAGVGLILLIILLVYLMSKMRRSSQSARYDAGRAEKLKDIGKRIRERKGKAR